MYKTAMTVLPKIMATNFVEMAQRPFDRKLLEWLAEKVQIYRADIFTKKP